MNLSRRTLLSLGGSAALIAGSIRAGLAAEPQSAANQWYPVQGDDGHPVPNLRAPVELTSEIEEMPGIIWGGGGPSPAATLVEFTDYNCPWCRKASQDLTQIMAGNPDLRVGLAHNAILSLHSVQAAKVQLAVLQTNGAKAAYALHQRLFTMGGRIDGPRALEAAAALGSDRSEIERVADSDQTAATLRQQMRLAASLGLSATPSFIIGGAAVLGYPGPKSLAQIVGATRACGTITC